jgi:hypothetical protein
VGIDCRRWEGGCGRGNGSDRPAIGAGAIVAAETIVFRVSGNALSAASCSAVNHVVSRIGSAVVPILVVAVVAAAVAVDNAVVVSAATSVKSSGVLNGVAVVGKWGRRTLLV